MEDSVAAPLADEPRARRVDTSSTVGWTLALVAHGALAITAVMLGERVRESSEPTLAVRIDHVVELDPPEVEPPPPPPPPTETPRPTVREPSAEPVAEEAAPALAAAADVVAAPADAETLDFSEAIVTGNAESYAGGTTHTAGASTSAVSAPGATTNGTGGDGNAAVATSRARSARIARGAWRCSVPSRGFAEDEDPTVLLRVSVDARGRATEVSVISAPDPRTGEEAADCARRTRFDTALDDAGQPIPATLPTLRVRLTVR